MLHGTATRDLDILFVPWAVVVSTPEKLIAHFQHATKLVGSTDDPTLKPHGRLSWTLTFGNGSDPRFIDASVLQIADRTDGDKTP